MTFEPPVPPPPPAQAPVQPPAAHAAVPGDAPPRRGGTAIASTVIGGVALLCSPVPVLNVITGTGAIVGAVLGILALVRRETRRALAILGVVLSVVALVLSTVLTVVYVRAFVSALDAPGWAVQDPFEEPSFEAPFEEPTEGGIVRVDGAPLGTIDAPDPMGTVYAVDDGYGGRFEIAFERSGPATDAVFDDFPGADPLPTGWGFEELQVRVTNLGDEAAYVADALAFEYIGDTRAIYSQYSYSASTETRQLDYDEPIGGGESTTASVLIAVRGDDLAGGAWRMTEFIRGDAAVITR